MGEVLNSNVFQADVSSDRLGERRIGLISLSKFHLASPQSIPIIESVDDSHYRGNNVGKLFLVKSTSRLVGTSSATNDVGIKLSCKDWV